MAEYDNNMRGVLFRADKKGIETRPDYEGSCEIGGDKFYISAWVKKSKNGNQFMSLSLKRATPQPVAQTSAPATHVPEFNDDLPF